MKSDWLSITPSGEVHALSTVELIDEDRLCSKSFLPTQSASGLGGAPPPAQQRCGAIRMTGLLVHVLTHHQVKCQSVTQLERGSYGFKGMWLPCMSVLESYQLIQVYFCSYSPHPHTASCPLYSGSMIAVSHIHFSMTR